MKTQQVAICKLIENVTPQGTGNPRNPLQKQATKCDEFIFHLLKMSNTADNYVRVLESLHPDVNCIISDAFFPWSLESASKLNIPRYEFNPASNLTLTIFDILSNQNFPVDSNDELFSLAPKFPNIQLTKNDLEPEMTDPQPGEATDFLSDMFSASSKPDNIISNSFCGLESEFEDYLNSRENSPPKVRSVGPLCLAAAPKVANSDEHKKKPTWIQWLDEMLDDEKPVLYVAFGSLAEITIEQFRELAIGLEDSGGNFLWVLRLPPGDEFIGEFEEKIKGRGLLVKNQWVDQLEILRHDSVNGFMSHCGWNSGWKAFANQYHCWDFQSQLINIGMLEWLKSIMALVLRKNVKKIREKARNAMEEGGSSWHALDMLIDQMICSKKKKKK
ncbi:hypothetical protein C5167_031354 [Papaver somniferum]|uniref:Uncharacterized protein n=1 Tax=Papaver somniferum TaxID=3469 RepID=A0A4Y7K7X6_PAPSO|nr:hypothetical protein C5167_031354 [Papaver somniferum]